MTLEDRRELVSVPYTYDINDKQAFERDHRTPSAFRESGEQSCI